MPLPDVIAAEDISEVLTAWADEIASESMEQPLRACLPLLTNDFESHFLESQGPAGAWAPRKDSRPHPLLILTGKLIEAARDTGGAGNIHDVTGHELTAGVDASIVKYAGFHQYGTSKMPARPFIWASAEALDECEKVFLDAAFVILVG